MASGQRQKGSTDITLLSLNQKIITPDRRFRVHHQAPNKWSLTLEQVSQSDDGAYFLCQAAELAAARAEAARGAQSQGSFIGGARLNVLGVYSSVRAAVCRPQSEGNLTKHPPISAQCHHN